VRLRDVSNTVFDVQEDDSYTGRWRVERRGRDLGLRRCDRVAVELSLTRTDTAKMSNSRLESSCDLNPKVRSET